MRHNVCCDLIEIHSVDFDQPQTRHYEQRNKRSCEAISIAENERKIAKSIRHFKANS